MLHQKNQKFQQLLRLSKHAAGAKSYPAWYPLDLHAKSWRMLINEIK